MHVACGKTICGWNSFSELCSLCARSREARKASRGGLAVGNNIMVPFPAKLRKRKLTLVLHRGNGRPLWKHSVKRGHPCHHVLADVAVIHPRAYVIGHHVGSHHLRRRKWNCISS